MTTLIQRRAMERLFGKGREPDLTTAQGRLALRRARHAEAADVHAAWAAGRLAKADDRAVRLAEFLERTTGQKK